MSKLVALGLAASMVGSTTVCAEADVTAGGEKWSQTEMADGWIKVTNEGGEHRIHGQHTSIRRTDDGH